MALLAYPPRRQAAGVFTRSFAEIEEPFEAVEAALLGPPQTWLTDAEGEQASEPHLGLGHIDVHIGAAGLTKTVRLSLGKPNRQPTKTSIPVEWSATGPSALFPQLAGTLEVARLGPRQTLLALLVEYRPPFGRLGEVLDEALLHRIAWATLGDFRDRVATSLAGLAHAPSSPSNSGAGS